MELCLLLFLRWGLGGVTSLIFIGSVDSLLCLGGVTSLSSGVVSTLTSCYSLSGFFIFLFFIVVCTREDFLDTSLESLRISVSGTPASADAIPGALVSVISA